MSETLIRTACNGSNSSARKQAKRWSHGAAEMTEYDYPARRQAQLVTERQATNIDEHY